MISALLSFFGGSAFRMIWGEVSSWLNKRQDHSFEIERLRLQAEHDAAQHARNLEAIKVQAELGVQTIRVAAEGEVDKIAADAWREAVKATTASTGIWLVDLWNGVVRPLLDFLDLLGAHQLHRGVVAAQMPRRFLGTDRRREQDWQAPCRRRLRRGRGWRAAPEPSAGSSTGACLDARPQPLQGRIG